jgi:hypothetical protein
MRGSCQSQTNKLGVLDRVMKPKTSFRLEEPDELGSSREKAGRLFILRYRVITCYGGRIDPNVRLGEGVGL